MTCRVRREQYVVSSQAGHNADSHSREFSEYISKAYPTRLTDPHTNTPPQLPLFKNSIHHRVQPLSPQPRHSIDRLAFVNGVY
jgi:hypothetical protein